ncbi:hypothetical protein [Priestia abyssalis]|uniref:hypothetical protein n=1 Tax=Priestia abyssalis TaxID=1221450 RepID=UPI001473CEA5|nr:hypothetical protein [Priestia abyssalis]
MMLSHDLTMEQKEYVKELKRRIGQAKNSQERQEMETQLNHFLERLFLEYKLRRRGEL